MRVSELRENIVAQRDKAIAQALNAPSDEIMQRWVIAVCMLDELLPDELKHPASRGAKGFMRMWPPLKLREVSAEFIDYCDTMLSGGSCPGCGGDNDEGKHDEGTLCDALKKAVNA